MAIKFEKKQPPPKPSQPAKRGRPKSLAPKEAISLRLDPDIIAIYKSFGDGWQKKINDDLRRARGI